MSVQNRPTRVEPKKVLYVYLPPALVQLIKMKAVESGTRISTLVQKILEAALSRGSK